jgi:hypothetical protein
MTVRAERQPRKMRLHRHHGHAAYFYIESAGQEPALLTQPFFNLNMKLEVSGVMKHSENFNSC